MHLYEALSNSVDDWRKKNYAHADYDIISEILEWAKNPEGEGFRLRPPQVRALETYWYLRLVRDTPHIFDLYHNYFGSRKELLEALGIPSIMIDTAYNGKVFNIAYSDVPERRNDLVVGEYELEAPKKKTTVAVKITDMLGEEVLETRQV